MTGFYPEKLEEEVKRSKKFIPRKLRQGEKLKQFHKYFCLSYGVFKVYDIQFINDTEYYHIKFRNYNMDMQAVISCPIDDSENCYELLGNYDKIEDKSVINNRMHFFTGAEIRFWFVVNNIDLDDEINYAGFKNDLFIIKDSSRYHVRRNKKNKEFEFIKK